MTEPAEPHRPNLGPYETRRFLGRGGMSDVWEAWDPSLGRAVAIKVYLGIAEEDLERFKREARLAAQLSHPNIVPVFDIGEADGGHYIVMPKIDGRTLVEANLPRDRAVEAVRDVARALHYGHEQGVVHRDVKPQNILIESRTDGFRAYLCDFGLARRLHDAGPTVTGQMIGTPAFTSPEQATAEFERVGPRSDVFGLGATLYMVLTGAVPFDRDDHIQTLQAVVEEDPVRPRKVNASIPEPLETITLKAMAKEPERRYASAAAFADDLDRYLRGEPIEAVPPSMASRAIRRVRRHRAILAGLAIGAALLAVPSLWMSLRGGTLRLSIQPADAVVSVDGERVSGPLVTMRRGEHTLTVEREGYRPQTLEVRVEPGAESPVAVVLERRTGVFELVTEPEGAIARLRDADGRELELRTPFSLGETPAGTLTVTIELIGHRRRHIKTTVDDGKVARERVALRSSVLWLCRLGGSVSDTPTLAVIDGAPSLLAASADGVVSRIDVRTGEVRWRRQIGGADFPQIVLTPRGGVLVAIAGGGVVELDGRTGAPVFTVEDRHVLALVEFSDDRLYTILDHGPVAARRGSEVLWETAMPEPGVRYADAADLDGDGSVELVVAGGDGVVHALRPSDGTVAGTMRTNRTGITSLTVAELTGAAPPELLVTTSDGFVDCRTWGADDPLWSLTTQGEIRSRPGLGDGMVFVGSGDGHVYAVEGSTGAVMWKASMRDEVHTTPRWAPVLRGGTPAVVVATDEDTVSCLDPRTGRALWIATTRDDIDASPLTFDIDGDGVEELIVASEDGGVYALAVEDE